jgi:hypothetical protein
MTVVSHERDPVSSAMWRYGKLVNELVHVVEEAAFGPEQLRDLAWALVETEMLRCHVSRRLSDRLDGLSHGPEGSVDKLLMTAAEQAVGHAALSVGGAVHADADDTWLKVYLYSRAQSVMGGTSQIQRNSSPANSELPTSRAPPDLPDELQVRRTAEDHHLETGPSPQCNQAGLARCSQLDTGEGRWP